MRLVIIHLLSSDQVLLSVSDALLKLVLLKPLSHIYSASGRLSPSLHLTVTCFHDNRLIAGNQELWYRPEQAAERAAEV